MSAGAADLQAVGLLRSARHQVCIVLRVHDLAKSAKSATECVQDQQAASPRFVPMSKHNLPDAEVDVGAAAATILPELWQKGRRVPPLSRCDHHRLPLQHQRIRRVERARVRHRQLELPAAALGMVLLHCEAAAKAGQAVVTGMVPNTDTRLLISEAVCL